MKYYVEESLRNFPFWSGAKDTVNSLSYEQIDRIESYIEEIYPDGDISDTEINDFFWFERETIAELLGYRDVEAMFDGDDLDWEDHYNELLREKFPNEDEDLISEFVSDEVIDNTEDEEVIEDFKKWLDDRKQEELEELIEAQKQEEKENE